MAEFRYTARSLDGKTKRGVMDAQDEAHLSILLKEQGLFLLSTRSWKFSRKKQIPSKELTEFAREMGNLLNAGISMARALDIIYNEEGLPKNVASAVGLMIADVRSGSALSEAMERTEAFPKLMIDMIRSAEGTGDMGGVMERMAWHYSKEYKLNQQVRSAMAYPCFLAVLMVLVISLMVGYVLPQFEELFSGLDRLPLITEILLSVSHAVAKWWYLMLLAVFALILAFRSLLSIHSVRAAFDKLKTRLPVIGKLTKTIYTARFARALHSLYSSGVPLIRALESAGAIVGNVYIEDQFEDVIASVSGGMTMSEAIRGVDGFLTKLTSTIMVGEESGRVDVMLASTADNLDAESAEATKRMVAVLEPMMIVFMAICAGFLVAAVMLPIYQSYGAIGGGI